MSYNDCTFIGNLGKDPEVRQGNQKSFTTFSVAVNKPGAEKDAKPLWISVTVFGSAGEFAAKYLKAGNQVLVQGPIELYEYQKDGVPRQILKLVANKLVSLTSKGSNGGGSNQTSDPAAAPATKAAAPVTDEDIPF